MTMTMEEGRGGEREKVSQSQREIETLLCQYIDHFTQLKCPSGIETVT